MIKFIYMLKILLWQNIVFLTNKREKTGLKHFNDSKAFIEYSNNMSDIYKDIEEYSEQET